MPRAPRRSQTADAPVAVVAGQNLADSAAPRIPLSMIGENDSDMTIFQQPWWLEAVSDNRYSSVTAGDGENAYLWWPFMLRQWCGFSLIGSPMMTHTLGPVIRLPGGKAVSQASQRRKLIETGLAQMPRASGFLQALEPGTPHAMDYNLAGFEIGVRYTYRLDARTSVDNLWNGLKDKARNSVRGAKSNLTISGGMPLMDFYALYERNLGRAGRYNHHDGTVYHRLNEALSKRTRHHIIAATSKATGKTVAATMVVWDAPIRSTICGRPRTARPRRAAPPACCSGKPSCWPIAWV